MCKAARRIWNWCWPLTVGALSGIGLLAISLWIAAGGYPYKVENDELPAWLQAIGSVAAILVAVAIDRGSSRRQAKAKRLEDRQRERVWREAVVRALSMLTDARDFLDRQEAIAAQQGFVQMSRETVLRHSRQLKRLELLSTHYLATSSASADVTSALAIVAAELPACIHRLLNLAGNLTRPQLLDALDRLKEATDAVDGALRETYLERRTAA